MLIPKKNRQAIYTYLFNEGVICAKKDFHARKHHAIDVPNLYVIKALQSLKSKGYVTEKFSWQWYYWYLTNDGTNRLREYLHLAEEVVPATLKPTKKSAEPRGDYRGDRPYGDRGEGGGFRGGRGRGYDRGDREGYRGYGDDKKSTPPPGDFVPSFREGGGDRGGRGRGFGSRGGYDREGGGGYRGDRGDREGGYRGGGEGGGYRGDREGGYRGGGEGFRGRGRGRGDGGYNAEGGGGGGGEYRRSEGGGGYRGGEGGGFGRGRGGEGGGFGRGRA